MIDRLFCPKQMLFREYLYVFGRKAVVFGTFLTQSDQDHPLDLDPLVFPQPVKF